MNTLRRGAVRCIVFKEDDTWYGTALELNIVVEADDPDVANFNLQEAIRGYRESLEKAGITTKIGVLNQKTEPEYEEMWENLEKGAPIPSPFEVHSYGVTV